MKLIGSMAAISTLLAGAAVFAGQAQVQSAPSAARQFPTPRMPIPTSALLPNTQALFDSYVREGRTAGIVGGFGVGNGPTLFVTAGRIADEANAPAADADSLWRVYSMTKPITGMAAMILVGDGKLKFDDPLSKYFPAFARMRVATNPDVSLASVPAVRPITIRNLLTHTAGLSYSITAKGPLLKEYERLGLLPGAVNTQVEAQMRLTRPRTLAEFANRVAQAPLIAQPGTKWEYSIGLDVMGAVIEKASGMAFDRFVQTRLLTPLGMSSTYWQVPASQSGRLSTNYTWIGERRVPIDPGATSVFLQAPSFPYGGAGLVSSARDYDRFLHMLQNGGTLGGVRVMRAQDVALGMSDLLPPGVRFESVPGASGVTKMPVKMGFGAGGSVYLEDGPGGVPGKGTYGWGGAAGTIAWVDPKYRSRGTVMVQYFPADKWPLRRDVGLALAKDLTRFRLR